MPDQEFKLVITGDATGAVGAAQQTSDAFTGVGKKVVESGEKAELSERSMRRLAGALGSDLPGAASALEAAFVSMEGEEGKAMAATMLLMAGLEILKYSLEKMSEQKKEATRITEELNEADSKQTRVIEAEREALDRAEVSEAEFHHNFVRNAQAAIDKAMELAEVIAKTTAATQQHTDDSNKGIAEKQIDDMEQRGVVSHATALKLKEQLDIQYEQAKLARQMAMDALEQGSIANQLTNAKTKLQQETIVQEPAAAAAAAKASADKAANDTKIKEANERIEKGEDVKKGLRGTGVTEDNIEKLKEMFQNVIGGDPQKTSLEDQYHALAIRSPSTNFNMLRMFGTQGDVNLANYEGANADIKLGQTDLRRAQGKAVGIDVAAGNAQSDLDAIHRDMEKNKADIGDLQSKLSEKKATDAINEGGAQADLNSKQAVNALASDRASADTVTGGGQLSAADAQKLVTDASKIAGHQVDLKTAAKIIENGANNMGVFMNQVGILAAAMRQINPTKTDKLQEDVDLLKKQMRNLGFSNK